MTAADAEQGWGAAPPGLSWRCPETDCRVLSPIADWDASETYCEDCGEHDARRCPACGESCDAVWEDRLIADATGADNLTPSGNPA